MAKGVSFVGPTPTRSRFNAPLLLRSIFELGGARRACLKGFSSRDFESESRLLSSFQLLSDGREDRLDWPLRGVASKRLVDA